MHVALTGPIGSVRTADQGPEYNLGDRCGYKAAQFAYVKNGAAAVHVAGAPGWPMSATAGFEVGKVADKLGAAGMPIGAVVGAIPPDGFGWMLVGGFADEADKWVLGGGAVVATDPLYAAADVFIKATLGTHHVCGQAVLDDTPHITGYFLFSS